MFFIRLQTATIIKSEYSTILSRLMSGCSSSVSLPPCFCLMKCNKTFLKVMWEMHISSSNTYKLEAQNIPFFFFLSKVTSSSMGNYFIFKWQYNIWKKMEFTWLFEFYSDFSWRRYPLTCLSWLHSLWYTVLEISWINITSIRLSSYLQVKLF